MQIKIILDDSEVEAIVNKMRRKYYSKLKIQVAGKKIMAAYVEFEKIKKDKPFTGQMVIDDVLKTFGGRVI